MFLITETGTGSVLKRRTERRIRRKLCRSIVFVKMSWLDLEDDPLLSFSIGPGFIVVFDGKFVDVFICAFCCVTNNFAANAEISIKIVRVLDGHGNLWTYSHILILDAPFIGVDQNMLAVCVKPYWCHLRRPIRHDGREIKQRL